MIKNSFKLKKVFIALLSTMILLFTFEFFFQQVPNISFAFSLLNNKIKTSNSLELNSDSLFSVSQQCKTELIRLDSIYLNTEEENLNDELWTNFIDLFTLYSFFNNISEHGNMNRLKDSERIPYFGIRHKTIFEDLAKSFKINGHKKNTEKLRELYSNEPNVLLEIDKYKENRINKDGFRSIEFKKLDTKRKKILLIGDSYTYGFSAMPFYNSFADLLLSDGYLVYNGGIPSAGTINYEALAQKYISRIQPDVVITVYYEDNDGINFDWNGGAFIPGYYIEQGMIPSFVNGQYLPNIDVWVDSLNSCVSKKMKFPLLRKSILYNILFQGSVQNKVNTCLYQGNTKEELTNSYLIKIKNVATANNAKNFVIVITNPQKDINEIRNKYQHTIFRNINTFYPDVFNKDDYRSEIDLHFNNSGHLKLKNFIADSILNNL